MARALRFVASRQSLRDARVLDFGCGSGRWHDELVSRECRYVGVDLSREMLGLASDSHPRAEFRKIGSGPLPFPDGRFDVVVSVAVLHHNDYPRQDEIIDELARVLRPGGSLLVFEGISRRPRTVAVPFYYRSADEWAARLARSQLSCRWQRSTRYFLLESIARSLMGRIRPGLRRGPASTLGRALLLADRVVDPYLTSKRPRFLHDRWFAVAEKTGGGSNPPG